MQIVKKTFAILLLIITGLGMLASGCLFLEKNPVFRNGQNKNQSAEQLKNKNEEVEKSEPHQVRYSDAQKILYMNKSNQLVIYNIASQEKDILLIDDSIVDYDISHDGNKVIYSKSSNPGSIKTDLYVFYVDKMKTEKIEEAGSNANPVFFPDDNRIVFVKRLFDDKTNTLSDGEVWTMDISKLSAGSKKLLGNNSKKLIDISKEQKAYDENGQWKGEYVCIGTEEIASPHIGIDFITQDGKRIAYWVSEEDIECSGLRRTRRIANADGSDFFTDVLMRNNSIQNNSDTGVTFEIYWIPDGSFVTHNSTIPPMVKETFISFDKNQKKIAVILNYDTIHSWQNKIFILDMKTLENNNILAAYQTFSSAKSENEDEETICLAELSIKKEALEQDFDCESKFVLKGKKNLLRDFKLINEDLLIYEEYNYEQNSLFVLRKNSENAIRIDYLN